MAFKETVDKSLRSGPGEQTRRNVTGNALETAPVRYERPWDWAVSLQRGTAMGEAAPSAEDKCRTGPGL